MADTPNAERTTLYVALLSFLAGVVSTGFGVYNARLNKEIAAAQQRFEGHEKFAALVRDSLDALSDAHKASLSLAGIYAVAEDDTEKRIVITIAAATHRSDVQRVLAVLVASDPNANRIAKEPDVTALITQGTPTENVTAREAPLASKTQHHARYVPDGATPRSGATQNLPSANDLRPPENTAQTDLLAALAKKSIGWVYYARFGGVRSRDSSECLPAAAPLPKPGETIALCSARYLRATKPGASLGPIVGVAQPGVTLRVQAVDPVPLGGDSRAVWLQVSTE